MANPNETGGGTPVDQGQTTPPAETTDPKAAVVQGVEKKAGQAKNKNVTPVKTGTNTAKPKEGAVQATPEPATSPTPPPADPPAPNLPPAAYDPNSPNHDPLHAKTFDDTIVLRPVPPRPSAPLNRERNYTEESEIEGLIRESLDGTYEQCMRDQRYHELFGKGEHLPNFRSYTEGVGHWVRVDEGNGAFRFDLVDSDFTFDHQTGELTYNLGHAIGRRAVNVASKIGVKAAIATGTAVALSFLTGPVGWVAGAAIVGRVVVGSGLGRAIGETARQICSKERLYHEQEETALIRFYKKERELAQIARMYWGPYVAGATFDPINPTEQIDHDQWQLRRTQAIKDLVNYAYSMEHATVEIKYRGDAPFVDTRPLPPGVARAGTEVNQPSNKDIDPMRIRTIRDALSKERAKWEKVSGISEAVGGAAWTAYWLFNGGAASLAHRMFDGFHNMFDRGDVVHHVDINGDWKFHDIQQLSNHGAPAEQVFHYNSLGEQMAQHAQGDTVIQGAAEHGSHLLGETAPRIDLALYNKALFNVWTQGIGAGGALAARLGLDMGFQRSFKETDDRTRKEFRASQEDRRVRNYPGETPEMLKNLATQNGRFVPVVGERWMQKVGDKWIELYVRDITFSPNNPEGSFVDFDILDERGIPFTHGKPVPILDVIGEGSPYYRVGVPPLREPLPRYNTVEEAREAKKTEAERKKAADEEEKKKKALEEEEKKKKAEEEKLAKEKKDGKEPTPNPDDKEKESRETVEIRTQVFNKTENKLKPETIKLKDGQIFRVNLEKGWFFIEIISSSDENGNVQFSRFTTKGEIVTRDKEVKSQSIDVFKSWFETADTSFSAPNFKAFEAKLKNKK